MIGVVGVDSTAAAVIVVTTFFPLQMQLIIRMEFNVYNLADVAIQS